MRSTGRFIRRTYQNIIWKPKTSIIEKVTVEGVQSKTVFKIKEFSLDVLFKDVTSRGRSMAYSHTSTSAFFFIEGGECYA